MAKSLTDRIPKGLLGLVPDALYVRLMFYAVYGRFPDIRNPVTFDEKIQRYKLKYRNPLLTRLCDKVSAREYVRELGYGHILNEIYFIKDRLSEEDFVDLPEEYVLKANHGCGMNIIKRKDNDINVSDSVALMNGWLEENYYYHGREWAYKNIEPKVLCEKYLENREYGELIDYKFYCYDGKPEVLFICAGRFSADGVRYNAYDMDWNRIYVTKGKESLDFSFDRPSDFEELKKTARDLCKGFPFVRMDLYSVEGRIYFGEFTFYPDSGIIPFSPDEYNKYFGDFFKVNTF